MNNLNKKLVIAVSSRALFDLEEEHALFEEKGYRAYRDYQVCLLYTSPSPRDRG